MSADVYSLNIIFIELYSGKNPFPGDTYQVLQAKINGKETKVPKDFPSKLKELVIQGCSKEPKKRPQIKDFQSALSKMLAETSSFQMLPNLPETKSLNEREVPKTPQEAPSPVLDDNKRFNRHNRRIVEKGIHHLIVMLHLSSLCYNLNLLA